MKTVDFSETIAASDLKGRRSRHLIDYMKICEYWRSMSFLRPWPKVVYIQKFKLDSLRNYCADLNQFFYESVQVQCGMFCSIQHKLVFWSVNCLVTSR